MQIEGMSSEEILQELKAKGVPTFGTAAERKDRLKKFNGLACAEVAMQSPQIPSAPYASNPSNVPPPAPKAPFAEV